MLTSNLLPAVRTPGDLVRASRELYQYMKGEGNFMTLCPYDQSLLNACRIIIQQGSYTEPFEITLAEGSELTPYGQLLTGQLNTIAQFVNDGQRIGWYERVPVNNEATGEELDQIDHDEFAMPHLSMLVEELVQAYLAKFR
ncbi:MAG: hypothetical protein H7319_20590 [Spirosoma sp.]|nr:hypothetical protein [Spirosoma sp.]